jgi:hypothetical protein
MRLSIDRVDPAGSVSRSDGHSRHAIRYIAAVAATIFIAAAGFVGALQILDLGQRKPPPGIANNLCADMKLQFLREHPPTQPTHLIVGSSVTWRNVAAKVVAQTYPEARPLNAGICGLQMNQTAFATSYLMQRYPSVTDVLLIVSPFDMGGCTTAKTAFFDRGDATEYLSGTDDLGLYFKYFDPVALARNAVELKERRLDATTFDTLVLTAYGDGPLDTEQSRGVFYDRAPPIDPACVTALAKLAHEVTGAGRGLVVVTMPMLVDWSRAFDRNSTVRAQLADRIRAAVSGTPARVWDAWSALKLPAAGYIDAVHLRWSAAIDFSRRLVETTKFGSRPG